MGSKRLEGKFAFVTGASSGIGEAIAAAFCEEGATVIGCGRRGSADFRHERFSYVSADITSREEIAKAVAAAGQRRGLLDILVNSAGITHEGSLAGTDYEDFERVIRVNLGGIFNVCKAALPYLRKSKAASIINIGSDLGVKTIPNRIAYCPSKAAVISLTHAIALEEAPLVRANCILPGLVDTPMIQDRFRQAPDEAAARASMAAMYPLKRLGRVDDIAAAALYLASDESSFVTGTELAVCGGRLA